MAMSKTYREISMPKFPIVVTKVEQTCGACPSQWDGQTSDNRQIYIRYRWGFLGISVGEIGDTSEFAAVSGREVFGLAHGDGLDGVLSYDELKELTRREISWP